MNKDISVHSTDSAVGVVDIVRTDGVEAKKISAPVGNSSVDITDIKIGVTKGGSLEATLTDFKRQPGESRLLFTKRMLSEGHTIPDAFLTCAASQIGQIMLTCPNALYKAGVVSGIIFSAASMLLAIWSMYILNILYLERKRDLIRDGKWKDHSQHVTQFHEVMEHHGGKWLRYVVQITLILSLIGLGIAQVVACASDIYYILPKYSKREWELIWGGILCLSIFIPTFRHMRWLNVLALIGTLYTACYIMYKCHKKGFGDIHLANLYPIPSSDGSQPAAQRFFTGSAVLLQALGAHAIVFEMMDAMEQPRHYISVYYFGQAWTIFLVLPHSILTNLAFPTTIKSNDNVYGIFNIDARKEASVWLMIAHQFAAFAYYVTPLMYMWEKIIGTHTSPLWIRLPSRLPVALLIWFMAVAFPFYGAINSLMSAITAPFVCFAIPFWMFVYLYRDPERRKNIPIKLRSWATPNGNWMYLFIFNIIIGALFFGYGFTAIAYSLKTIVQNAKTYGVFAKCYQCPKVK